MKTDIMLIFALLLFLVISIFIIFNQTTNNKFLYKMNREEELNRQELLIQLEKIKADREELRKEIDNLKTEINKAEENLTENIKTLKLKTNVPITNFSDSSYNAILRQLRTK